MTSFSWWVCRKFLGAPSSDRTQHGSDIESVYYLADLLARDSRWHGTDTDSAPAPASSILRQYSGDQSRLMAPTKPQQVPVADHDNVLAMSKSTKGWYTKPHLLRLNYSILSLVLLSSSVGYDASCMNGLLALPTWNEFMNYPTGAWLGFINCAYVLGVLVALPLCPYVNNRYGRKMGIYVGYAFLIPGVIMQTCAQNEATFIASRAFIGINTAWYANSAPVLIAETAFPAHRVRFPLCRISSFSVHPLIYINKPIFRVLQQHSTTAGSTWAP